VVAAPVARQAPQSAPTARAGQNAGVVPFPIASLKRNRQAFDTGNLSLGQQISALEIPAAGGFLRFIEMNIAVTSAGNSATVVFKADAPANVLSFIEFLPPSGDPPIVPHTGYQLLLWNKYGAFSQSAPFSDPRRDRFYTAVAGAGTTGGSANVTLRLPFEIDPMSGFCAITNSAANKSYLLNLIVNTSAAIYSTAPTVSPTVRVTGIMYYWDEPAANTRQGTQQTPGPLGLGSFSQLRIDQPPITAGDKYIKLSNTGPVMRQFIWVLRASDQTRASVSAGDIPATWDFVFNTRDRFLLTDQQLMSDMGETFGYGIAYAGTNLVPTFPPDDGPSGLDVSVRCLPYFLDGGVLGVSPTTPRSQYQVTADATLTQLRGISFGATVTTLELLTNLIRPASAAALYPPNRIS
jgi:hypothetical protein